MKSTVLIFALALSILVSSNYPGTNFVAAQELEFVGQCEIPPPGIRLTVVGDYAYIGALGSGFHVISIADPAAPMLLGRCDTPGWAFNVAISGNYAFVADSALGIQIINISDPTMPTLEGNVPSQDASFGVFAVDEYLYVCDGSAGLFVYSIANPVNPVLQGSCDVVAIAGGIYVKDSYAYLGDFGSGLAVIDIDDPSNPHVVGYCGMECDPWGINMNENYAYVAVGENGFQIIDTSDPENPVIVGGMPAQWFAHNVFSENHFAFMTDLGYGVKAYDVLDPASPVLLDTYLTPGNAYGIFARQNYIYVANDGYFTVLHFDPPPHQCDPEALYGQPATMPDGSWWALPSDANSSYAAYDNLSGFSGTVNRIRFWGGPMYFAGSWQRCYEDPMEFDIIFFEDDDGFPGNEICRRSATTRGVYTGILYPFNDLLLNVRQYDVVFDNSCEINGGWISVQGTSYGGDPQDCVFMWSNSTEGDGDNICLFSNATMYEWCSFDLSLCLGEETVDIGDDAGSDLPEISVLKDNHPNPFNAQTAIEFDLAKSANVNIEIYDLLGRKLETLLKLDIPAGHHQVTWSAKDKPSGVYFYRIQADDHVETRKMLLLK